MHVLLDGPTNGGLAAVISKPGHPRLSLEILPGQFRPRGRRIRHDASGKGLPILTLQSILSLPRGAASEGLGDQTFRAPWE